MFGLTGIVLAISYRASGAEDTIWVAVSEAIAPTIIALLAIKCGTGGTDKIDIFAFVGSLVFFIEKEILNNHNNLHRHSLR